MAALKNNGHEMARFTKTNNEKKYTIEYSIRSNCWVLKKITFFGIEDKYSKTGFTKYSRGWKRHKKLRPDFVLSKIENILRDKGFFQIT